ncbi:MAG: nucleoside-diphosphate kinase [Planctomycetota bacterium]
MSTELAYVLITPYSLLKSRTGGIISRVLALSGLDPVGARLYAPSDEFVAEYRELLAAHDIKPDMKAGLLDYLDDYFRKDNTLGITNRTLLLLFQGDDAIAKIRESVGSLSAVQDQGNTVRGTYGDFIGYTTGEMKHFEPAVFIGTAPEAIVGELKLFAKYADSDGGILEHVVTFDSDKEPETTLVMLKPDNFKLGSSRPGNIIDMFSRTGLCIVGARLFRMSIAQAEEFYRPLRTLFVDRLKSGVAARVREILRQGFEFPVSDETADAVADLLKDGNAEGEFNRIVQYMSGGDPYVVTDAAEKQKPGTSKCLALLYRGIDAVEKIRECLGSTNPQDAAPGTVRSVYGDDLMKNGAHASDSPESAERERKIIGMWENVSPSDIELVIDEAISN